MRMRQKARRVGRVLPLKNANVLPVEMRGFFFLLVVSLVAYFGEIFFFPPFLLPLLLPYGVFISGKAYSFIVSTFYILVSVSSRYLS